MLLRFKLINDWRSLFKPHAIGGRLASFTLFNISYMRVGIPIVDGFTITILGIGMRIYHG